MNPDADELQLLLQHKIEQLGLRELVCEHWRVCFRNEGPVIDGWREHHLNAVYRKCSFVFEGEYNTPHFDVEATLFAHQDKAQQFPIGKYILNVRWDGEIFDDWFILNFDRRDDYTNT